MRREQHANLSWPAVLILSLAIMSETTKAQEDTKIPRKLSVASGKLDFHNYCAPCHGKNGTGDGPVGPALKDKPSNLTLIARNNGGIYPGETVYNYIDGSKLIVSHGPREMPIWGYAFVNRQCSRPGPDGTNLSEEDVKLRIESLVYYIKSIQAR